MKTTRRVREELSPLDGRYREALTPIRGICSERGLVASRIRVEIQYLRALSKELQIVSPDLNNLSFDHEEVIDRVFVIEKTTHHDVKAVELAIKEQLEKVPGAKPLIPFIHFGLTSQDVTSVALWLQIIDVRNELVKKTEAITSKLRDFFEKHKNDVMLARTHGQPATPTTMGKELMVFAERLTRTQRSLQNIVVRTKFGGATGGFNAHVVAYPEIKWPAFADKFLLIYFGMERQQFTTQIDHYDGMAEVFDAIKRINTVLIDLCRDVWQYISREYLVLQPTSESAVGSSTMPHKLNPIQFENAQGNLVVANALLEMLARKLPVSMMQRDLTDSTVSRNIGVAVGHSFLAMVKILEGLERIKADAQKMLGDLANHWEVVTEGLQTVLRSQGESEAYDHLKTFVKDTVKREGKVTERSVANFITQTTMKRGRNLVQERAEGRMRNLSPTNYIPQLPNKKKVSALFE